LVYEGAGGAAFVAKFNWVSYSYFFPRLFSKNRKLEKPNEKLLTSDLIEWFLLKWL
jgi:hypothetical protein